MFPIQVSEFCIPIITKHRSISYTLTCCFLNEDGICSVWDKKLTLIKWPVLKGLNKEGRQKSLTLLSNNSHLPRPSMPLTMKVGDTLVPSTKIHSVTFQKTVILTLPENLWSHILTLFFPNDNRIFTATGISICVTTDICKRLGN